MKQVIITIVFSIIFFIGLLGLVMAGDALRNVIWNNGICYRCENAEWKFDGVHRGYSEWYCPECYATTRQVR